ncbi:MAG: hypothetical protein EXR07_02735 [Acetobacteraceae bacterium]|nr:hypothetical protein [Acetobacteraceae bacterium]
MARVGRQRANLIRAATALLIAVVAVRVTLLSPAPAWADDEAEKTVRKIMQSGDGKSAATAYRAPRILWEYEVLIKRGLRFQRQRTAGASDVITAFDTETKSATEVWFRVVPDPEVEATAQQKFDADAEDAIRNIMRSGDGLSPETAFVVGAQIPMEYRILRYMGLKPQLQGLVMNGGCGFDVLTAIVPDSQTQTQVYFNIGDGPMRYNTHCTVNTKSREPK